MLIRSKPEIVVSIMMVWYREYWGPGPGVGRVNNYRQHIFLSYTPAQPGLPASLTLMAQIGGDPVGGRLISEHLAKA